MKTYTLNNAERAMWIDNDEGLYLWWKRSRLSKATFIRENKTEIDALILSVMNKEPRK